MFSYHNQKTSNFEQAKTGCKNLGRRLAIVEDEYALNEITTYENTKSQWGYWWLGAEKQEGLEEFYWVNGKIFDGIGNGVTISLDEPGNRCLALYTRSLAKDLKVFSMSCDRHLYYICETLIETSGRNMNSTVGSNNVTTQLFEERIPTSLLPNYTEEAINSLSTTTLWESMKTAQMVVDKNVFAPSTEDDVDPVAWMFVAIGLALLLVVSVVIIAKLWTDNKKLRNRIKATAFMKARQDDHPAPSQRSTTVAIAEGWRSNGTVASIPMTSTS